MPAKLPFVVQNFPKFEAFDLFGQVSEYVDNGSFLTQLIQENPNHIVCFLLAPLADEVDQKDPMFGSCTANRVHEIVEHCPHVNTVYFHAVLCIWKPSISNVHAFVARHLRYCFTPEDDEGSKALHTLKEVAPFTQIVVSTYSEIFDGEFSQISPPGELQIKWFILDLVRHILLWKSKQKGYDRPFPSGWV